MLVPRCNAATTTTVRHNGRKLDMYYVVLPDGQKFGPADLRTLNQWASEGRILSNSIIEDSQTGQRFHAASLPGLQLTQTMGPNPYAAPGTMNPPQPYAAYTRPSSAGNSSVGTNDLTLAYVFGAIGLAMCVIGGGFCSMIGIVFPILGLVYAKKAQDQGNPSANSAKILCYIALGIQVLGIIVGGAMCGMGLLGGGFNM